MALALAGRLKALNKLGTVGFGAFSRIFALGSQFVVLILLGKLLAKADFGDFMIVYALTRVLATGMGTGLATLLVYHVSRNASAATEHSLHRTVALVGALVGGAISAGMMLFATQIAGWFGKPSLVFWLYSMAPFTLFYTLLTISVGVFDGRGRITRSILASEFFPNLIRLLALPPLMLLHYGNGAVALVMIASVLLPWLAIVFTLFRNVEAGFARLTGWDLQYSGKLTLHSFAAMQMQGIDMLVVGWLFSSVVAADYAIASRVAALIPFLQQIIVKTFMARAGRAIHEHDQAAIQAEIDRSRYAAVMLVTLTAVLAMFSFPILLLWMGKFSGSLPLLAALAIGPIVRSYFPGADALLRIAGLANSSLLIMLTSGAFIVLFPVLFDQLLGIYSIALGMFASAVLLNPLIAYHLKRTLHVRLATAADLLPIGIALAGTGLCMSATGMKLWIVGLLVITLSLLPTYLHQPPRSDVHAQPGPGRRILRLGRRRTIPVS